MRSSTTRFAAALFAARGTVIPCASSAAAVRVTRASSAGVANRRLSVLSRSGWTAVMSGLLTVGMYLRLQALLGTNLLHVQKHSRSGDDVGVLFGRLIEES